MQRNEFILTTCSAQKDPAAGLLRADERYSSARVQWVRVAARERGLPLLFLSGVFGIVQASEPLPVYDHALQPGEVEELTERAIHSLRELGVRRLHLYLRERSTPGWAPYYAVLDAAAAELDLDVVSYLVRGPDEAPWLDSDEAP